MKPFTDYTCHMFITMKISQGKENYICTGCPLFLPDEGPDLVL